MPNNANTFFKSLRYLLVVFIFALGLITVAASGGGGGDDSSGTTDNTDPTDTTDDTTDSTSAYDPDNLPTGTSFSYTDDDATPTLITFAASSISVTGGDGASAVGRVVTITSPGTYNISSEDLQNGQIVVNTADTGDVRLCLNNADLTYSTSAPIDIESAERVIIVLQNGTENSLRDNDSSGALDGDGEAIDAAIYSKEDLVIYGTGKLTVYGDYWDGIKSKDGLIIDSGTIEVYAADDGIIGKNYVSIEGGDIAVNAVEGDGLKSTNDGDTTQGYIFVQTGNIDIDAGADAIQVETHLVIKGGTFNLTTAGGSTNTAFNEDLYTAKGLKGPIGVTVYGGVFDIDSADDAIHSNDTIVIHGGAFDLASGDDAIHADLALTINDGVIDVSTCYEGIESLVITINDGEIHVLSTDDPINATDGSGSMMSTAGYLYLNGGYMYFNCVNADGLDSNGTVVMKGGTVIVNGPVTGANGILDYASFTMSGGLIIGAGTSNMAQAPGSAASAQYALLLIFNQQTAGTLFHIETSAGTDIVTFKPAKAYASVVFSSSSLAAGDYVYNIGGTYTGGTNKDGLYTGGTYSGGTDTSFTISSKVTTVGTAPGGGPGGGMP